MILCLDCGNSRMKWGLRDGAQWRAAGALGYDAFDPAMPPWVQQQVIEAIVACNVAGPAIAKLLEAAFSQPVYWIASRATQCGVRNGYDIPESLGVDRWAALIGARTLHDGPAIVVMAGTATTIDILDGDGRHLGGVILPGLGMMTQALAAGTAGLPAVDAAAPFQELPRNTRDAMASGALLATIGAINGIFEHIAQHPQALCLVSGGAAPRLRPLLDMPCREVEYLVLEGLVAISAEGRPA